jgi:hypothetical protein
VVGLMQMLLRRHDAEMLVSNEQIFDLSHRLFLRVRTSQNQVLLPPPIPVPFPRNPARANEKTDIQVR